ncbi:hypothetical protein [Desulfovibrio legallii]|uniref:Uncharacterized protein n=1 Tax=Desulfovibrio legallii TaxID=571438 RepID=A0A1G7LIF1_9BACT|nr:hypothetical protein [Desulfovibrio legallii]SDF49201.1 hypothetical protein SAMN05192586_10686 [Desulfovibrio legallii]
MSVSSISGSYTSALYQWQNQQLTSTGSSSSQSSTSSSLSSLLSSYSITSQVSSMVELTQYAMDAMGLEDGSRVTFSQILKYRDQLTSDFNASVQEGLAALGVSDPEGVTFTLAADGSLTASSDNATDQQNVQNWLTTNPDLGTELRAALTSAGVDAADAVSMTVDSTGKLTATAVGASTDAASLTAAQSVLTASDLGSTLSAGMNGLGVDADVTFTIQVNDDGTVTIAGAGDDTEEIQQFFDDNPDLVKQYRQIDALSGLDDARKALQLSPSELRQRIQLESMAAWWSSSDSASSYFGSYSDEDGLSLLAGLNLSV